MEPRKFIVSFFDVESGGWFDAYIKNETIPTEKELIDYAIHRYADYNETDDKTGITYTTLRIGKPISLHDILFRPLKQNNHERIEEVHS